MKKLLSLCAAVCCVSFAYAENSVITYKADSKLAETTDSYSNGLRTNAFGVAIQSHEFADGVGTITFDGEVTYFGSYAFYGCDITSIDLPATVDSIGDFAFTLCANLSTIDFSDNIKAFGSSIFYKAGIESFVFPKRVKRVSDDMFAACKSLKSVTFNDSITAIGDDAFRRTGLESIVIPNSVKTIGMRAFSGCDNLISITLPNNLVTIESDMCEGCEKLESIILPESLKEIGSEAFVYCNSLKSLFIPQNIDTISPSAFATCAGLTSIIVDESNTHYNSNGDCNAIIETATNTLISGCKNTVIPESVIALGDYAFGGCAIDSIVIPKNVTSVGSKTFFSCENLKTAYCLGESVPTASKYSFRGIDSTATLYVQAALVESFKADEIWNNAFKNILPLETPTPTAVENASVVELYAENGRIVCEGEFRIYDLLGRDVTRMNGTLNGVYVVTCGDKATKIVVR